MGDLTKNDSKNSLIAGKMQFSTVKLFINSNSQVHNKNFRKRSILTHSVANKIFSNFYQITVDAAIGGADALIRGLATR